MTKGKKKAPFLQKTFLLNPPFHCHCAWATPSQIQVSFFSATLIFSLLMAITKFKQQILNN